MEMFIAKNKIECRGYNKEMEGVYRTPKDVSLYAFTHEGFDDPGPNLDAFSQAVRCDKLDINNPVTDDDGNIVRYRCKAMKTPDKRGFCPLAIPPAHDPEAIPEYESWLNEINK